MNAIEQNKFFQTEFSLFLMSAGEEAFWNTYLNNVNESNADFNRIAARAEFVAFRHNALGLA